MLNIEECKNSFENILQIIEQLKPVAEKNKVSPFALMLLLAFYLEKDFSYFLKNEYVDELLNLAFIEKDGNSFKLTGKGAIYAKSLERVLK